jgi:hypothetical protein
MQIRESSCKSLILITKLQSALAITLTQYMLESADYFYYVGEDQAGRGKGGLVAVEK